jgi:hypothetical protein
MNFYIKLLLIILVVAISLMAGQATGGGQSDTSCALVGQALTDSQQIKVGIARGEVERFFEREGGAQFPGSTKYVYKKCRYLHIDVEFETKGAPGQLFSSNDLVVKTSKLYVDFPAKD